MLLIVQFSSFGIQIRCFEGNDSQNVYFQFSLLWVSSVLGIYCYLRSVCDMVTIRWAHAGQTEGREHEGGRQLEGGRQPEGWREGEPGRGRFLAYPT